jgi:hypothetical protein
MAVEPRGERLFAGLLEAVLDATLNKLRNPQRLTLTTPAAMVG